MRQEVIDTIKRYFNKNREVQFFGNKEIAQKIVDFLSYGKKYLGDAPDMAIVYNDECLAVEHFEFDCYKKDRSGSQNRKEQARIEREFQDTFSGDGLQHDKIKGKSSYEQYVDNVLKVFDKHYRKISDYKENLRHKNVVEKNTNIKIAFLIEDASPLASMVYDGQKTCPIVLALSKEFLEHLSKYPDVNYIISCSSVGRETLAWLIIRDDIEEYIKHSIDYTKMKFIDWEPQVTSFSSKVEIPRIP